MSNTYAWKIEQVDCYPTFQGQADVAFNVHWRLNATDGASPAHNATRYGSQPITFDPKSTFTPFDQLTEAEVIGWVQAALGADQVSKLEAACDADIENQITPPTTSPKLPWAK